MSTAAAAQHQQVHPEALQQRLLDQLRGSDEVTALTPEQLLEELKALQLHALYGVEDFDAKPGQAKVLLGEHKVEQFLVEQVGVKEWDVKVGGRSGGSGSMSQLEVALPGCGCRSLVVKHDAARV
jgi:hypothetical protein